MVLARVGLCVLFFFCCCASLLRVFFFFSSRRLHTRSLCDWSSDVCSSDLQDGGDHDRPPFWPVGTAVNPSSAARPLVPDRWNRAISPVYISSRLSGDSSNSSTAGRSRRSSRAKIGRASCRERAWTAAAAVL